MEDRIEALFDEYLDLVLQGRAVGVAEFLTKHADLTPAERERVCVLALALAGEDGGGLNSNVLPPSGVVRSSTGVAGVESDRVESFGHYRLLRELGRGGQGVVYLAHDTRLSRKVALKVLTRPDLAAFADSSPAGPAARLRREAEVASRLDHPGICVVYEMEVVHNSPYIAMRYIEGETLAAKIAAARTAGRKMLVLQARADSGSAEVRSEDGAEPLREQSSPEDSSWNRRRHTLVRSVRLIESAARALHAAHEAGVVHRDLKPANVMVTPEGEPVLLDFGLARDQSSAAPSITQTGEILGSPGYMSPEQISSTLGPVDRRTDVYSLGVVLYECLTLRRPFEATTREALFRAILAGDPPDPRRLNAGIDRELAVVLETALEKDRDRRYKSALELADDLRRWCEYEPILARPASPMLRVKRWTQRNRILAASLLALFTMLVALLIAAQAEVRRKNADAQRLHGALLTASSSVALPKDPALALLLAIQGANLRRDVTADNALHAALAKIREKGRLQADAAPICGLVVAPDGKQVITASKAGLARVWDVASWRQIAVLSGPARELSDLDSSSDGRWLASVSAPDRTVLVWSTAAWDGRYGVEIQAADFVFHAQGETVGHVRFCSDGERLLTWSLSGIGICSIHQSSDRLDEYPQVSNVTWAAWDPSGKRVMIQGPDRIWNPTTGASVDLEGKVDSSFILGGFNPDGSLLVNAVEKRGVCLWNAAQGRLAATLADSGLTTVALFSPDGQTIFTGHADGTGALFDARSKTLQHDCRGHVQPIGSAAFSRDGRRLTTISGDGSARIWDARTGKEIAVLVCDSPVKCCAELGDGERLVTGHMDGSLRSWDRDDGWTRGVVDGDLGRATYFSGCFDESGTCMALTAGNQVRIYDARTHARLQTLANSASGDNHDDRVHRAVFTHDGRSLLTASADKAVRLWDVVTGVQTGVIGPEVHKTPVWFVDVSSDDERVVTASEDGRVRVFDLSANRLLLELVHDEDHGVWCAYFSKDGRRIVSTSQTGRSICVWDAASGELLLRPRLSLDDAHKPMMCRFSPDGARLVAGTAGGLLLVWKTADGEPVAETRAHTESIDDACYSPDSKRIVTGSADRTMCVWDAETRELLATVNGHQGGVSRVVFSPSGAEILSISNDSTAHLWCTDPLAKAGECKLRALTEVELERYDLPPAAER